MTYLIFTCLGWLLGLVTGGAWSLDSGRPSPIRSERVRSGLPTCTAIPTAWRRAHWRRVED